MKMPFDLKTQLPGLETERVNVYTRGDAQPEAGALTPPGTCAIEGVSPGVFAKTGVWDVDPAIVEAIAAEAQAAGVVPALYLVADQPNNPQHFEVRRDGFDGGVIGTVIMPSGDEGGAGDSDQGGGGAGPSASPEHAALEQLMSALDARDLAEQAVQQARSNARAILGPQ